MGNPNSEICHLSLSKEERKTIAQNTHQRDSNHRLPNYPNGSSQRSGEQSLRLPKWIPQTLRVEIQEEFLFDGTDFKSTLLSQGAETVLSMISMKKKSQLVIIEDKSLSNSQSPVQNSKSALEPKDSEKNTDDAPSPKLELSYGESESSSSVGSISVMEHNANQYLSGNEFKLDYLAHLRARIFAHGEQEEGQSHSSTKSLLDIDFEAIEIWNSLQRQLREKGFTTSKICGIALMERIKIMLEFRDGMLTKENLEDIFITQMKNTRGLDLGGACCKILSSMMRC